eukprot:g6860.t1
MAALLLLTCLSSLSALLAGASLTSLEPFQPNSIRVRVSAPGQPLTDPPISALKLDGTASVPSNPTTLTNGNLKVELDPTSHLLTATRVSDGAMLLKQTTLKWNDVDATSMSTGKVRDGSKAAVVRFAGSAGEQIYGLGEHSTGRVQRSPYRKVFADSLFYGKSHGSDVSIPMYTSSIGYAFVWNSPALGSVDVSDAAIEWVSNATLGVDMWISAAPAGAAPQSGAAALPALLSQYAAAVGPALPMPSWSTGFIQCKDRYRNQTQLLDVARGYKARKLPISMIVIE